MKGSAAFQQVRALVPQLTPGERNTIRLLLGQYKGGDPSGPGRFERTLESDWLFKGIEGALERRGLAYSIRKLERVRALAPGYEADSAVVRSTLERLLRDKRPQFKQAELLELGEVVARCLIRRLTRLERYRTLGISLLLNNVDKSLEALNDSFPGYLASGMIDSILKSGASRERQRA